MLESLLAELGVESKQLTIKKHGSGLINNTWVVEIDQQKFILQRINHVVFKNPYSIAHNIDQAGAYLQANSPDYLFPRPITLANGHSMADIPGEGYFRMFPFIEGSQTIDVVETPSQAFEAASQFGRFTRLLQHFDLIHFKTTIPDFHNLTLRYHDFLSALKNGNPQRLIRASSLIKILQEHSYIASKYEQIVKDQNFIKRVTHHDTKISNVLFDHHFNGLCVIDLDTVMPGYFISDLGDMMRTYLSPVSEEEQDFDKIEVRTAFYEAVVNGYFNEMKEVLTETEKQHFFYAGTFMIYMQAIRFLTDYLCDDVYYGEKYPGQNFVRAGNQTTLLQRLIEKEALLSNVLQLTK